MQQKQRKWISRKIKLIEFLIVCVAVSKEDLYSLWRETFNNQNELIHFKYYSISSGEILLAESALTAHRKIQSMMTELLLNTVPPPINLYLTVPVKTSMVLIGLNSTT